MTPEELVAALRLQQAERRRNRKPGRPREQTPESLATGMRRFVVEVFAVEARIGVRRGAMAAAIAEVAGRFGLRPGPLKKAVQRNRHLRWAGQVQHAMDRNNPFWLELDRRLSGMPDDVREASRHVDAFNLLGVLREEGIDGTAPEAFVDAMRMIAGERGAKLGSGN